MSKLLEQINQDLKQAMMAKNAEATSTLRLLVAAARNKEISLRPTFAKASAGKQGGLPTGQAGKAELTAEQMVEVVASEIKKRQDAILAYEQGRRPDLAEKEKKEIKILEKYLPAQLSDQELEKIILEIVEKNEEKNFGKIMSQVMARVKGRARGDRAGEMVKKLLAKQ